MKQEITTDGFKVVYISEFFYNALEVALNSVSRSHPNQIGIRPIALRDAKAMIEFRRWGKDQCIHCACIQNDEETTCCNCDLDLTKQ